MFSIKILFTKCDQTTEENSDFATFTKEILNEKLHAVVVAAYASLTTIFLEHHPEIRRQ